MNDSNYDLFLTYRDDLDDKNADRGMKFFGDWVDDRREEPFCVQYSISHSTIDYYLTWRYRKEDDHG
ncbi:hypothetical protein ABD86_25185 [Paenibacillus alvei]|nr:hypothetical protein [Paenibacillus alvei]MBG9747062.1 hypothetical protein [Paenibacillus alvei]